ncbi:MAG: hypothetical protein Q7R68_10885 [Nitrospirales bacterium]|nr:hypothetical protein [Nitrospirales bacterium]
MELNLYATSARPEERFHWQAPQPWVASCRGWRGLVRRTTWTDLQLPGPWNDPARFTSWVIGWFLQIYYGSAKCDGSRTQDLRNGTLGGNDGERRGYVMTTTPSELLAVRWRGKGLERIPRWDNMGGA